MCLELDPVSFPATFMYKDHLIQDSLMAATVFGDTIAPKCPMFEWPKILLFCSCEVFFADTCIHYLYVAAEIETQLVNAAGEICRQERV